VPDALRAAETLGENVHERGINVVNGGASLGQLGGYTTHTSVGGTGNSGFVTILHEILPLRLD
jgi:hypothetical protein